MGNNIWIKTIGQNKFFPTKGPLICVECNQNYAERMCKQCHDAFCENCYISLHQKGKRAKHKYRAFRKGAAICIECEIDVANKFCSTCGDKYCSNCFNKVHEKGKKSNHKFEYIRMDRVSDVSQYCNNCHILAGTHWCRWCDVPFCDTCLLFSHPEEECTKKPSDNSIIAISRYIT